MIITQSVTIASGGTDSSVVEGAGRTLIGIVMDSTITGATLAVHGGAAADATAAMYDDVGAPVTVVATDGAYVLTTWALIQAPYLKLVSDSAEGDVRTLTLVFKEDV